MVSQTSGNILTLVAPSTPAWSATQLRRCAWDMMLVWGFQGFSFQVRGRVYFGDESKLKARRLFLVFVWFCGRSRYGKISNSAHVQPDSWESALLCRSSNKNIVPDRTFTRIFCCDRPEETKLMSGLVLSPHHDILTRHVSFAILTDCDIHLSKTSPALVHRLTSPSHALGDNRRATIRQAGQACS